jgi:hypothetical protein
MKAAEHGRRYDAAHVLDGAMDRSVLVERPMSPQPIMGLRRIEWVILGVEDSTNLGIARGFCILAGLYLASMMDGTSIETPSAAVGYVFVSGFSAGADSTRDFR